MASPEDAVAAAGMHVAVIGLGYVGAVTAACLAGLGHRVTGVDVDAGKVASITSGRSPIVEPRLDELVASGRASGCLEATTDLHAAMSSAQIAIVCVGTPSYSDGMLDLTHIERVTHELGATLRGADWKAVVYRSTMLPGTVNGGLRGALEEASGGSSDRDFGVAMVPEFLREGSGVADFFDPPFTALGVRDDRTHAALVELFRPIGRPLHRVEVEEAEALKYACNAFHAVKVTFANEIGSTLKAIGVDSRRVMRLFCEDDRLNISDAYLRPGFAFGGSCLPKDLSAFNHLVRLSNATTPMIGSVLDSNERHLREVVRRVLDTGARRVALIGLAFKAQTDDLRRSPYVEVAETLVGKGVDVRIFDPVVNPSKLRGANKRYVEEHLPHLASILVDTPDEALRDATAAIVATANDEAIEALLRSSPPYVLDLHGVLGERVESLSGYDGVAW